MKQEQWKAFVDEKKMVEGDIVVFLRGQDGDFYIGIRKAKKGHVRRVKSPSVEKSEIEYCEKFLSALFNRDESERQVINDGTVGFNPMAMRRNKVKAEAVIEAVNLASNGKPFEVVYYPTPDAPEFCVKASSVKTTSKIRWCPGMRLKMAFETEDSSETFMGTISSVQVSDPIVWPDSPWNLLQVTLYVNTSCVCVCIYITFLEMQTCF